MVRRFVFTPGPIALLVPRHVPTDTVPINLLILLAFPSRLDVDERMDRPDRPDARAPMIHGPDPDARLPAPGFFGVRIVLFDMPGPQPLVPEQQIEGLRIGQSLNAHGLRFPEEKRERRDGARFQRHWLRQVDVILEPLMVTTGGTRTRKGRVGAECGAHNLSSATFVRRCDAGPPTNGRRRRLPTVYPPLDGGQL